MYHKKKIALFISHIFGDYQKNLCQGVINQALDYGYQTEVYATTDGEDLGDYGIGESSILRIPNFDDISGIVFASGTYSQPELKDRITELLKNQKGCPVIEITEYQPNFPAISLENNLTTGTLTEHLITVHNCKHICYLGSKREQFFSDRRQKAFETVMDQHSLPFTPDDIFLCDESPASYDEAVSLFTSDGNRPLDAVVCYNDRVAIGFWLAALRSGYEIPKDFALVGCDCSKAGQNLDPPLTSVTFPSYQVGTAAVSSLVHIMQGTSDSNTTVFAEPVFAGSCGCSCQKSTPTIFYTEELTDRIGDIESSMIVSMQMSAAFSHITDIDEGMDLLEKYVSKIEDCSEFYICLYSNWDSLSSHILELTDKKDEYNGDIDESTILLKLAIQNGKRLPECSFNKTSLLPEFIKSDSDAAYIVSPLFFEDRAFGYVALAYEDNRVNYHFQLVHWIMNITQLLQNICESKRTHALTQHLESIYMKDVLTGLYNHHGYQHYEAELLQKAQTGDYICALLFDLDELKTINDHFGHAEGDFALRVIGQALTNASKEGDICSRFSGDEFFVLICEPKEENAKDFILRVEKYLTHYNSLSTKPYNISISAGYAARAYDASLDLEDVKMLFTEADKIMYSYKKSKEKHVLR